jgi:hypothetical protein
MKAAAAALLRAGERAGGRAGGGRGREGGNWDGMGWEVWEQIVKVMTCVGKL